MQQRIITFSRRFTIIDSYGMDFDEVTKQLNEEGWVIKQIVSTSFNHELMNKSQFPVLVITLLIKKD